MTILQIIIIAICIYFLCGLLIYNLAVKLNPDKIENDYIEKIAKKNVNMSLNTYRTMVMGLVMIIWLPIIIQEVYKLIIKKK